MTIKKPPLSRRYGLSIAKKIKNRLSKTTYPIKSIYLFGSCATDKATSDSDIDIAVICNAFDKTKIDESVSFFMLTKDLDPRQQIVVLHPDDLGNRYSTLAQEIKRHGIAV